MFAHKVLTTGAATRVDPMPPRDLLDVAPDEVRETLDGLQDANRVSLDAERAVQAARKARRLEEVPSRIPALEDEITAAEKIARARLQESRTAAKRLASALDDHAAAMGRNRARRDLEDYVSACDALPALSRFLGGGRAGKAGPTRTDLAPHVDPVLQARPDLATVARALDETDVPGLLERAEATAEDFGLVEVRRRNGGRVLTTEARAAMLTGGDWTRVGEEVST